MPMMDGMISIRLALCAALGISAVVQQLALSNSCRPPRVKFRSMRA